MRYGQAWRSRLVGPIVVMTLLAMPTIVRSQEKPPTGASSVTARVVAVVVSGTEHVLPRDVQAAITRTQPGKMLRPEDVQADLNDIGAMGYFQSVTVDVQEVAQPSGSKGEVPSVRVVFRVVENPVVRRIELKPAGDLASAVATRGIELGGLGGDLGVPLGKVAHAPTIRDALQTLPGKVWEAHGVAVAPGGVELSDDGVLTIELLPVRVHRVEVDGNQRTRTYVITREVAVKPGDIVQKGELEKSLRRVLMLQFFEDVGADLRPVPGKADEVDLVVKVTERRTGTINFGASYSENEGLVGMLQVSDSNFLGRGQEVGVELNYGSSSQRYRASFTEPYLDAKGTSLGFTLGYERVLQKDRVGIEYWDTRYGGDVTLGRPLSEYTRGFVTLSNKITEAPSKDPSGPAPDVTTGTLRSVRLRTVTDTSDHPFNPSTGQRLQLSAEVAGFGGSFHYNKFETTYSRYFPVRIGRWKHVLATRVSAGKIVPEQDAPDQELFTMGGAETLRGYGYGDVGEGPTMAMANLEYRFPIYSPISGVIFADTGYAWGQGERVDLSQLKSDVGFGIRIDVPALGMIRLDYGMTKEGPAQFHFSIGQQF